MTKQNESFLLIQILQRFSHYWKIITAFFFYFSFIIFHKNITKLVFLWPNISLKSFKVLSAFIWRKNKFLSWKCIIVSKWVFFWQFQNENFANTNTQMSDLINFQLFFTFLIDFVIIFQLRDMIIYSIKKVEKPKYKSR